MSEGISLEEFEGDPPARDFRRANGAPMVRRLDDPTKWDRYARPSGFGNDLDDENALTLWKIDRAMEGVAMDPSIAATVAAHLGIKEGQKERRERAIQRGRGDEAADIGTALHAMTHRVERGDSFVVPPPYDADIATYMIEKAKAGLESDYIEVHLCCDEWRAAGTADRIYRVTRELKVPSGDVLYPGQLIIGDLKTGKLKDYSIPGYCIQLAIYADGVLYDVEQNVRIGVPEGLRTDWGLIVHMPAGEARCELLWCDLQVGRKGAKLVQEVRAWRKRNDFLVDFEYPSDEPVPSFLDTPMARLEFGTFEVGDEPDVADGWYSAMSAFAQRRVDAIGQHNEPRASLIRKWPEGIPPIRQGMSCAQLTTILDLLDAIEGAYSLPFPVGDPRVEWSRGLHKSQVNHSNKQAMESEQ